MCGSTGGRAPQPLPTPAVGLQGGRESTVAAAVRQWDARLHPGLLEHKRTQDSQERKRQQHWQSQTAVPDAAEPDVPVRTQRPVLQAVDVCAGEAVQPRLCLHTLVCSLAGQRAAGHLVGGRTGGHRSQARGAIAAPPVAPGVGIHAGAAAAGVDDENVAGAQAEQEKEQSHQRRRCPCRQEQRAAAVPTARVEQQNLLQAQDRGHRQRLAQLAGSGGTALGGPLGGGLVAANPPPPPAAAASADPVYDLWCCPAPTPLLFDLSPATVCGEACPGSAEARDWTWLAGVLLLRLNRWHSVRITLVSQ